MPEKEEWKCAHCGREDGYLYRCSTCGAIFCNEHKNPESHNCDSKKEPVFLKKEPIPRSKSPILVIFLILSLGSNGLLWLHYDPIIKGNEVEIGNLNEKLLLLESRLAQKEREYLNLQSVLEEKTVLLIQKEKDYVELQQESLIKIEESYNEGYNYGYETGHSEGFEIGNKTGAWEGYLKGIKIGNETGFEIGLEVGARGDYKEWGMFVRDPTYKEVRDFVRRDTTDRLKYVPGNYTCHDFTKTFKNNAYESGYRCFYVWIEFREGLHAIVGFNTTDRGIVYIEPQNDEFVKDLKIGVDFDDLVTGFRIGGDTVILDFDMMW